MKRTSESYQEMVKGGIQMVSVLLMALALGTSVQASQLGGAYDELTDAQKAQLQVGEQVFFTVDVEGSAWPKVFIYQRIDSTPEEAVAVFWDIELQPSYISSLKKAQIIAKPDRRTVEAAYTVDVPVLADESYTTRSTVRTYDQEGPSYRVDWEKITADTTQHIEGNARFESLGTGTIMAYYNFVIPGSGMAGWVKSKALKQVRETADAIVQQVELEIKEKQDLLQTQISEIREAVAEN